MPDLPFSEKEKIIRRSFWDRNIDKEFVQGLLAGKINLSDSANVALFARVIQSNAWYTIFKVFDKKALIKLLDDRVLNLIYPKELKEKYIYARKILSH